jgi:hypothetical protein
MATTTQPVSFGSTWHWLVLYGVGILALLALADPYPVIATWIVALLIALVLLTNWPTYLQFFSGASTTTQKG